MTEDAASRAARTWNPQDDADALAGPEVDTRGKDFSGFITTKSSPLTSSMKVLYQVMLILRGSLMVPFRGSPLKGYLLHGHHQEVITSTVNL